eukprot:1161603-Pelagomonas_calceolata.AAC.9
MSLQTRHKGKNLASLCMHGGNAGFKGLGYGGALCMHDCVTSLADCEKIKGISRLQIVPPAQGSGHARKKEKLGMSAVLPISAHNPGCCFPGETGARSPYCMLLVGAVKSMLLGVFLEMKATAYVQLIGLVWQVRRSRAADRMGVAGALKLCTF